MAGKMKTHSGAGKRFKITKKGKVLSAKSWNNHLLIRKGRNHKKFSYGKKAIGAAAKMIRNLLSNR